MFHYFTIKFHFSFFASFRFKFFASLQLSNFRFEAKQSEAKFKSIFFTFFAFFHFFSLFFAFFRIFFAFFAFFRLKFCASLRFSNFCFETKQSEAKINYDFSFFSFFSLFSLFLLFLIFSLHFRFAAIFSLNFRLFYLHFRFRFLLFRIEVNHVKSGYFFASK